MHICPHCGFKYMLVVYEAERHIFLRCPNEGCYKLETRLRQLDIRGKIVKSDGYSVEVNVYDGEINK